MRFLATAILLITAPVFAQNPAPTKDLPMHHAHGTFSVATKPSSVPAPADGLGRFTLDKQIEGDLAGTGKGEMLTAGDAKAGAAGYVAIEMVTGTLGGKKGSFALQHSGTMDASGLKLTITVVPGSGTGDLKGIAGTFVIHNEAGKHSYDFDYTLPE
jgi:hypothetical protein